VQQDVTYFEIKQETLKSCVMCLTCGCHLQRGDSVAMEVDWNCKFRVFTTCGQVWEYNGTNKWADGALQQLCVSSQTNEGEKEADVLVLGGSTGRFG